MSKRTWKLLQAKLKGIGSRWLGIKERTDMSLDKVLTKREVKRLARIEVNSALVDVCHQITAKTKTIKDNRMHNLSFRNGYHDCAMHIQFAILKKLELELKDEN